MRRFACLLAFVMFGWGLGLAAPPATAEQMIWKISSSHDYRVQLEFYSQDRNAVWPGGGKAYPLNDSKVHTFTLNCQHGEKICYGGWPTGGGQTYWGVGVNNKHRCKTCCAICGLDNPVKTLTD